MHAVQACHLGEGKYSVSKLQNEMTGDDWVLLLLQNAAP